MVYTGSRKLIWEPHRQMCGENHQNIIIELIKMVGMQPHYYIYKYKNWQEQKREAWQE